jgi:hypothetical protein
MSRCKDSSIEPIETERSNRVFDKIYTHIYCFNVPPNNQKNTKKLIWNDKSQLGNLWYYKIVVSFDVADILKIRKMYIKSTQEIQPAVELERLGELTL